MIMAASATIDKEVESTTKKLSVDTSRGAVTSFERATESKTISTQLKEEIKLVRTSKDEAELDKLAKTTIYPEVTEMLFLQQNTSKVRLKNLILNPNLMAELHQTVAQELIALLPVMRGDELVTIAKSTAPATGAIKLHILTMQNLPEDARYSLCVLEKDQIVRYDAIITEVQRQNASAYIQTRILEAERRREFKAIIAKFTTLQVVRDKITSPETDEWLQLEFITSNYLTERDIQRLRSLRRPEIDRKLNELEKRMSSLIRKESKTKGATKKKKF